MDTHVAVQGVEKYGFLFGWGVEGYESSAIIMDRCSAMSLDEVECGIAIALASGYDARIRSVLLDFDAIPSDSCWMNSSAISIGSDYWATSFNQVTISQSSVYGGQAVIGLIVAGSSEVVDVESCSIDAIVGEVILAESLAVSLTNCRFGGRQDSEDGPNFGVLVIEAVGTVIRDCIFRFYPEFAAVAISPQAYGTVLDSDVFVVTTDSPIDDQGQFTTTNNLVISSS